MNTDLEQGTKENIWIQRKGGSNRRPEKTAK